MIFNKLNILPKKLLQNQRLFYSTFQPTQQLIKQTFSTPPKKEENSVKIAFPEEQNLVEFQSSYFGASENKLSKEVCDVLLEPLNPLDVEIKPDGIP